MLAGAELFAEDVDQNDDGDHEKNGKKMGEGKVFELNGIAFSEKICEKVFHKRVSAIPFGSGFFG